MVNITKALLEAKTAEEVEELIYLILDKKEYLFQHHKKQLRTYYDFLKERHKVKSIDAALLFGICAQRGFIAYNGNKIASLYGLTNDQLSAGILVLEALGYIEVDDDPESDTFLFCAQGQYEVFRNWWNTERCWRWPRSNDVPGR